MACSPDFIDSICGALAPLGEVRVRKMMGDYVIYVNGKYTLGNEKKKGKSLWQ